MAITPLRVLASLHLVPAIRGQRPTKPHKQWNTQPHAVRLTQSLNEQLGPVQWLKGSAVLDPWFCSPY